MTENEIVPPQAVHRQGPWKPALFCALLLAAQLYAIFFDLGGQIGPSARDAGPPIATFTRTLNEVRSRFAGTITWNVPPPGAVLHHNDSVLTMSDAQANVEFTDGSAMTIEPESLVVLEKSSAAESTPKITLRLLEGSLAKRSEGRLPIAVALGGQGAVLEDPTGKALFHLKRSGDSMSVEVDRGQLKLTGGGGSTQTLGVSQRATVTGAVVTVADLPLRFAGLAPDSGRPLARDKDDEKIALHWDRLATTNAARGLGMKVLVSRHADLADAKDADVADVGGADSSGTSREASFEPDGDGGYFWQVVSDDGAVKSPVASFSVVTKTSPEIDEPGDGDKIVVGQNIVFRWKPRPGAHVFLETSATEDFSVATRLDASHADSSEEQTGVAARYDTPQTIYWRLRADYGRDVGDSKPSETRKLIVTPRPLLKPPKGIKARVRIETSQRSWPGALLARLVALILPDAAAAEPRAAAVKHVVVELEWESVEGAEQYHLQISETPDFTTLLVDRKVRNPLFSYRIEGSEKDRTLYFRVAGIDGSGAQGEFSDKNDVEVEALRPPEPVVAKKSKPEDSDDNSPSHGKIEPKKIELAKSPGPSVNAAALAQAQRDRRGRIQLQVAIGAAYHSRTFKSDTSPTSATGNGLVPAYGSIELRRWLGTPPEDASAMPATALAAGVSLLAEKAEPSGAGVMAQSVSVPLMRAWLALEKPIWGVMGGVGLYGSTSQKFSWSGTTAAAAQQIVLGVTGMLTSSPTEARNWHWRTQLALLGAGGKGADASAYLRRSFGESASAVDYRGTFVQTELMVRYLDIEASEAFIVEIGYAF